MEQLKDIKTDMQAVLGFVEFNEGHRYGDYMAGTDKVAAYGIAALVAGKLAAKAGLFKILVGLLIAGKKFAIIAVIGLLALAKKLFSRKPSAANETVSITGSGESSE